MRPPGNPATLEKRRLRAIALLKAGHSYRSVASEVHSSISSLVRWYQAYRRSGRQGLRPKPTPGRPPLLSEEQKEKLIGILSKGPLTAGYTTDMWTLRRIGEVIEKHFGVDYSLSNLWQMMQTLGWSCQKPEKRARERNERAIQTWKRRVWPGIKKNPTA